MKLNRVLCLICIFIMSIGITSCKKNCKHESTEWIIDKVATCTTTGLKHKECTSCHKELGTSEIKKINHIYQDGKCTMCGVEAPSSDLLYELNPASTGYIVKGLDYSKYDSTMTRILIPDEYDGLPVVGIKESAFAFCSNLTSIEIPNSVTYIGENAFMSCDNLLYNLYNNGLYLGNNDNPCLILAGVNDTNVTSMVINNETRVIYSEAFYDCANLEKITMPNNLKSIGTGTFNYCRSLVFNSYGNGLYLGNNNNPYLILVAANDTNCNSFTINEKTRIIYCAALYDCEKLIRVTIPASVKSIGIGVFPGELSTSPNLKEVYYQGTIENWCNIEFASATSNPMQFAEKFYMINDSGCNELTRIDIPNTVKTIGAYQFMGFKNITKITLPEELTTIAECAFQDCSSLKSIKLPSSLTKIEKCAFVGCSNLTSIIIPKSVTTMGEMVFIGNNDFTIYCEASSTPEGWYPNWNVLEYPVVWGYNNID